MAEASIDRLTIEIQASAASAQRAVRGLSSSLGTLGARGQSAASGLSAAARATRQLDGSRVSSFAAGLSQLNGVRVSSTIGKNLSAAATAAGQVGDVSRLSQLATSLARLDGVKVSASIANQLERLPKALSAVNSVQVDAAKLAQLREAVTALSELPKSNLATTITQLKKLPEAVAALDSIDMAGFAERCRQLSDALGKLPQKMSAVARGFGAVKASGASMRSLLSSGGSSGGLFSGASADADSLWQKLRSMAYTIKNVTVVYGVLKAVANRLGECLDLSNQFIEDMNLADTSLGQYAQQARDYADQVKTVLGVDNGAWLRNQGVFMSMAQGMGVASDKAYTMSQGLTQLGYDLASFFNISNDEAMQKLQSGLSGEIEPLRRLGYDLTEARLQQEAYNLGISESVSNMTQAEKAMLRYEAIMNQVSWAQGDMAKTISSPSNMLRVLQDNANTAARSIGNVFLPMLQAILPVAIAAAKVVATLANMLADLTGGSQIAAIEFGAGDAGETAASGLNDMADAAGNAGKNAGSAAKQAKELKRELMGFDEINMFSRQSSGSGSGGSGGGSGSGGGGNGASSIPVQSYDFLGDATGLGDGIYNAIMDAVERAGKAFAPLVESAKTVVAAIMHQFDGLDIGGAIVNSMMGAVNLVSNAARNIIEVLGPLAVAFNFPETIALAFDLAAQACLTLSAAINAVGSMVKGFTDVALVQLVAWVGDKVRAAIYGCIDVLQSWQDWFQRNTQALNTLGQYAGVAAALVLRLAEAVADVAFSTASVLIRGVSDALQLLLGLLVNSEGARVAAAGLGAALAAWAVGTALSAGIGAVANAFQNLAGLVTEGALGMASASGAARASVGDLTAGAQLLAEAVGDARYAFMEYTAAGRALKSANEACATAVSRVKVEFQGAGAKADWYQARGLKLQDALGRARDAQAKQNEVTKAAEAQFEATGKLTDRFAMYQQQAKGRVAAANVSIAEQRTTLNAAKAGLANYTAQGKTAGAEVDALRAAESKATSEIVKGTAAKGLATAAEGAWTVAKGAATVAQNLLNAAMNAFPGMIVATALNVLLQAVQPLIDNVVSLVKGFLGLDDATGDVTETTEEANQVLSEEQQRISDNVDSIREYERSHDSLRDALAASRMSEEQFASYLQQTGQTFDDVAGAQDAFVTATVNGFEAIDTSTQLSLESVNSNLQKNLDTQRQWSEDLQTLMAQTGKGANDSLIQSLTDAGPEKMAAALHEVVTDPASEQSQQFLALMEQTGSLTGPTLAAAIAGGSSAASGATGQMMDDVNDAVAAGGEQTASTAQSVDEQTVEQFGSHYNEAKDAGRNLAGGFGDGIAEAAQDAVRPAREAMRSVVDGLNGGDGYARAVDAGRNVIGGYSDGIASAASQASSQASQAMRQVVDGLNGGTGYTQARSAGANLMGGYKDGLNSAVRNAVSVAKTAMQQVTAALGSGTATSRTKGSQTMQAFVSGLQSGVASARSAGAQAARSAQDGMGSNYNGANSAGRNEMGGFIDGLAAGMGNQAWWKGRDAANSAASGMGSNYWGAYSSGSYFTQGFEAGISSRSGSVYNAAYRMASRANQAVRDAIRQGSPSKVMRESGMWFDLGMKAGIDDYSNRVSASARAMAQDALSMADVAADAGREAGAAFGDGLSGAVAAAQSDAYAAASSGSWRLDYSARAPHAQVAAVADDGGMAQAVAYGVQRALAAMPASGEGQRGGDATIVLRVGSEELARTVIKGARGLARRGAIELS